MPKTTLEWATRYRFIEGRDFSLNKFRPLQALYEDRSPHIVIVKPAQRGVSEYLINFACFALECGAHNWTDDAKNGLNVGYFFPTREALFDFSRERVRSLRRESDHLQKIFGREGERYDNLGIKQVGESWLYLRGANSDSGMISFPADVAILDEFDRMPPSAPPLIYKRLNASDLQYKRAASTPRYPSTGITLEYESTDQQEWWVYCKTCEHHVQLDFFESVFAKVGEDSIPSIEWLKWDDPTVSSTTFHTRCPDCQKPIRHTDRGEWRAARPGMPIRGYRIPWYGFPMVRLENLARAAIKTSPEEIQVFWNDDLGIAYEAGGSRVSEEMLAQLSSELPNGRLPEHATWTNTTMGIDVGNRLHVRISSTDIRTGMRCVRFFDTVGSTEELDMLWFRYKVRCAVMDANPETRFVRAFQEKHPHRVYRAYYAPYLSKSPEDVWRGMGKEKKPDGTVHIKRTALMDKVLTRIARLDEHWPEDIHGRAEIRKGMIAPLRTMEPDSNGNLIAIWKHTTPDDFYHAAVYDVVAQMILPSEKLGFASGAVSGWF